MSPDRYRHIKDLFHAALARDPAGIPAFLDAACADDPDARREVESLLNLEHATGSFLARPAVERDFAEQAAATILDHAPRLEGRRIGAYRIKRLIAAGGMGAVYEAVQDNPSRTVALKVMKAGLASPKAISRFRAESQLLARLRHPHIAQVYEAGEYDDGAGAAPFFAMEFIPNAKRLITYADDHDLGARARLELFSMVCGAIQHAHQHGVIHRDLKPSNILVEEGTGYRASGIGEEILPPAPGAQRPAPSPKIIDFGLARAADADLALVSARTDVGELFGTLQYMSPEQCEGDPSKVDARSDVYALGVILYELLCGQLPYDLTRVPAFDAPRLIRETLPTRPSTIDRALRGDLETIALTALQKDPARRYQSAESLCADITRYLKGEPINARRDSLTYVARTRCRSYLARHPVVAAAGVVLVASAATAQLAPPLFFTWTPLARYFERALIAGSPAPDSFSFEHVAIIAVESADHLSELALARGVAGIDPAANPRSLRRLHGHLMQRLAEAKPKTVAFDIAFPAPASEFDPDFAAGVAALRQNNIDVTVYINKTWRPDDASTSPGIYDANEDRIPDIAWGPASINQSSSANWLDLAVEHPGAEPRASLALQTFASFRHPGSILKVEIDPHDELVHLRYAYPDPQVPSLLRWPHEPDVVPVSAVRPATRADADNGIQPGDTVASMLLNFPPPEVFEGATRRATHHYQDVLAASDHNLAAWFAGKVVLIGQIIPGTDGSHDRHDFVGYGRLAGYYANAYIIEQLIAGTPVRLPTAAQRLALFPASAGLGVLIVFFWARPLGRRYAALALAALAMLLASSLAYRYLHFLYVPLASVFALLLAAELMAAVERACRPRAT